MQLGSNNTTTTTVATMSAGASPAPGLPGLDLAIFPGLIQHYLEYQILYCQACCSAVGHGSLPWQGLKASEDKRNERIKEKKVNTSIEDLCGRLFRE